MAHKLIALNPNIKVHQALHGYVDGHREVVASKKLSPHDAKTMLILSDISSSGIQVSEEGYLTGYPLAESGCYAIAKTWLAPEMKRPGCVWTHTLLIDFADLANLNSARGLFTLFRRPIIGKLSGYDSHLAIECTSNDAVDSTSKLINSNSNQWRRQLLLALYGCPAKRIISTYPTEFDPLPIILAVWFQQWPRLRRAFCFCTYTATERSNDRVSFDLQLIPKERSLRGLFPKAIDIAEVSSSPNRWIDHAIEDFEYSGLDSLRTFFRRVGGDVSDGRRAFAELTILHKLIENSGSHPELFDEMISLLDGGSIISLVTAARIVVASKAAFEVNSLSDKALEFLVCNLSLLDKEVIRSQAENIGYSIWVNSPATFAGLLDSEGAENIVISSTIASLSCSSLIDGMQEIEELVAPVLALRQDVLLEPQFWGRDANIRNIAFEVLQNSRDKWPSVISAMMVSGVDDVVKPAFNYFGFSTIWLVLAQKLDEAKVVMPEKLLPWLDYAFLDKDSLAKMLLERQIEKRHSIVTIARMTAPDSVPNAYGLDPWLSVIKNVEGDLDEANEVYFMSYLLSRALGPASCSRAELSALAFDQVYSATLTNSINPDAWSLLNGRLPYAPWWDSWDRCRRLRRAIAELFVSKNLSAVIFGQLSHDDRIFEEIAGTEMHLYKGRRYLKKVREVLRDEGVQKFSKRIRIIDKLLN